MGQNQTLTYFISYSHPFQSLRNSYEFCDPLSGSTPIQIPGELQMNPKISKTRSTRDGTNSIIADIFAEEFSGDSVITKRKTLIAGSSSTHGFEEARTLLKTSNNSSPTPFPWQ